MLEPGAQVIVVEEPIAELAGHAEVSSAFEVRSVYDVETHAGAVTLSERRLAIPYWKDYDALEAPADWPRRFDVARWGLLAARIGGRRVGGAVVAFDTPGLTMLHGRLDLAVLWDIRVAPAARGAGVGRRLFAAAERWAAARRCRRLDIETQNINVPACRCYTRQGCTLGAIDRSAYPDYPDEIMLLWQRSL